MAVPEKLVLAATEAHVRFIASQFGHPPKSKEEAKAVAEVAMGKALAAAFAKLPECQEAIENEIDGALFSPTLAALARLGES